jgi:hypothetical protein
VKGQFRETGKTSIPASAEGFRLKALKRRPGTGEKE